MLWNRIDTSVAVSCNLFIQKSPFWQNVIAFLNSKKAHWVYDVIIGLFILPAIIKSSSSKEGVRKLIVSGGLVGWAALAFFLCNRILTWKIFSITRCSPSIVLPDFFNLAEVIHWTVVKVASNQSFPSDHGSTFVFFTIFIFAVRGYKWGALSLFFSIPFAMPRLVVGAHWLSDYALGSFCSVLLHSGWLLGCPFIRNTFFPPSKQTVENKPSFSPHF